VPITEVEKQKLDAFVAGRDILKISNYVSTDLDSVGPVEQFIFRKAVLLGGLNAVFQDEIVPNSARAREEVGLGHAVCSGAAQWHHYLRDYAGEVLESDAVIASGRYVKGLYATQERARAVKIMSLGDLKKFAAVSSDTWVIDWDTLKRLPLKALYSGANRTVQFRMVQEARADFTLQDFAATSDMSIEEGGVRLYPISGVKIALDGSRHFFISKKHPDGAKVFAAVQKGLALMRQSGEVDRILTESGFYNRAVRDWMLLNKPENR